MKIFKKGEIVIYAVALMLVTAGYFNYMHFGETVETSSSDYEENLQSAEINQKENNQESNENNDEENKEDSKNENSNTGDAVLVSNNEVAESTSNTTTDNTKETSNDISNYYTNSKIDRDKMYAEMISNYQNILNNTNATEAQKTIATQEITKINNTKNAIMICENLIENKDFNNCLILVNENNIEIVINTNDGLNTTKVAQIQNIITRELGAEIQNIHITEK